MRVQPASGRRCGSSAQWHSGSPYASSREARQGGSEREREGGGKREGGRERGRGEEREILYLVQEEAVHFDFVDLLPVDLEVNHSTLRGGTERHSHSLLGS